jgi:Flp pilus assembly protein TadD
LCAILCEILTGRPPYAGSTREEIRSKAARGDLADARGRLEACGADAELIDLARDCLAADLEHRPRNAGEVVRRISGHLAGVQERLKAAELARVEAQAKATEERKRRRLTVALAASVLVIAGLAGGGWAYLARQRHAQLARIDRAVNRAEVLYAEAQQAGDDPARWITAQDAAQAVESLLIDAPDEPTGRHMTALVREVAQAALAAENDQKLLAKLVEIRSAKAEDLDGSMTDMEYANAFAEAGIDTAALAAAEVGAKIQARPATVRVALAAALDDWAAVRRGTRGDKAGARRLAEVASRADPDPWRNRLRNVLQAASSRERLADLKDLAKSARVDELPAVSLNLLGATLLDAADPTGAEMVLREAQRQHPGDVWLNHTLAQCLERLARREEAIRYYFAARSLRPETAHELAHALEAKGETDQAIGVFQDLARLRPKEGRHLTCCGEALQARGRKREADVVLEAAIAASRAAVGLRADDPNAHFHLGNALKAHGKLDEAITEYRTALRLKPDSHSTHNNLGITLQLQGKLDRAITELRAALRLKPDEPFAHNNLGITLKLQGKLDEAVAEFRAAVRLKPDHPSVHDHLGHALRDQGKLDEAVAEYREALRLNPGFARAHHNLGAALHDKGEFEEAIAEFRAAIQLRPDDLLTYLDLGGTLLNQGEREGAVAEFRRALRLKPDSPRARHHLGIALRSRGEITEAVAELRKARDLAKADPGLAQQIERELARTEQQASLTTRLPAVLSGKFTPSDAAETLGFALLCYEKKLHAASARLWAEAFQAQPTLAEDMRLQHRYNAACAAALAGCGQGKDDPPLDDATKARWRRQAIDWLKADLGAWPKILASGPPQARQFVAYTLQHWKANPDLAGIRDHAALARLPEDEQNACRALWSDVDALLTKVRDVKR